MSTGTQSIPIHRPKPRRTFAFGPFRYDSDSRLLRRNGHPVVAPPRALAVLSCLLEHPGEVMSKDHLMDEVWGDVVVSEASLSEAVRVLRQALGDDPKKPTYIETMPKLGYRLAGTVRVTNGAEVDGRFRPQHRRLLMVAGAAVALLLAVAVLPWFRPSETLGTRPLSIADLELKLAQDAPFALWEWPGIALSPDGRFLAYTGASEERLDRNRGGRPIFVRVVSTGETRAVAESRRGLFPTFSTDGETLTFWRSDDNTPEAATGPIVRIALTDGSAEILVDAVSRFTGGTWTSSGAFVYGAGEINALMRVEPGRDPETIAVAEPDFMFFYPQELPTGDFLVTLRNPNAVDAITSIAVVGPDGGNLRVVAEDGLQATFLPSGHLVYASGSDLLAAPFDAETRTVTGPARQLVAGVSGLPGMASQFAVANRVGMLAYVDADETSFGNTLELWEPESGTVETLPAPPALYQSVAFSPDGRELVVTTGSDAMTVWRFPLDGRSSLTKLTHGGRNRNALWTPDGASIIFNSSGRGTYDIYRMPVDGGGPRELLVVDEQTGIFPDDVSSDGRHLAYTRNDPEDGMDIWMMPLDGSGGAQPFLATPFNEYGATFSPDGRWVAYTSDESGEHEVYVRPVPPRLEGHDPGSDGERYVLSTDCGALPLWSPTGGEIFFRHPCTGTGNNVWSVAISTEPELSYGSPVFLFSGARPDSTFYARWGSINWDVSPDGRRLALIRQPRRRLVDHLEIRLDLLEKLRLAAPGARR